MALEVKPIGVAGTPLKINSEGSARVVVCPHPPKDEELSAFPFRQYFTTNGASCGTFDMQVAASAACPQEFYIQNQNNDRDVYIKTISIIIADQTATLSKFGAICALANGVEFFWISTDRGQITINDSLKSNFDFIRLAGGVPSFGDGASAFIAGNVEGTSEGIIPTLDLAQIFGLPWGIRLRQGTNDRLVFKIKDNTTGVDAFNAVAYGIELIKENGG